MRNFRKLLSTLLYLFFSMKFLNYLIHLPYKNSLPKNYTAFNSKEFQIELKNLKFPFYYFGNGQIQCYNKTDIFIATQSTPSTFNLRMGIRNSWRKDIKMRSNFTHKFFIGWTWNETLQKSLKKESEQFGDIIFTNIVDSYFNLTFKMNSIFQWHQNFCPSAKYLLRADEDTVIDISRLQYWINNEFLEISNSVNELVMFGHLIENSPTIRNSKSKWYVSYNVWNRPFYPNYMNGASYLLTSKAVKAILKEAKNHSFIAIDDAFYTGIVAESAGILRIDSKRHFWKGNPLLNKWNRECDTSAVPLVFSIFDELGEIEMTSSGYEKELKKLKTLNCSVIPWEACFTFILIWIFFFSLHYAQSINSNSFFK